MVVADIVCRDENYGQGMGWGGKNDLSYALEGLSREARQMFEGRSENYSFFRVLFMLYFKGINFQTC